MKKYGCMLGIAALIGGVVLLVMVGLLIYTFNGTGVRLTIDGPVLDNPKLELRAAVASGDPINIRRAFDKAIYCSGQMESEQHDWMTREAIPTMQGYLSSSSPVARLYAAKALYMFGDSSGYPALLDLINSNPPLEESITAAELMAQYRQLAAASSISELYSRVGDSQQKGQLLKALVLISPSAVAALVPEASYHPMAYKYYAFENYDSFLPQITNDFRTSPNPEIKTAAAWALALMVKDTDALDYLVNTAQAMLNQKHSPFEMRDMVKYLGSVQDARMKPLLERALDSDDSTVVQCAIINLLYNQGGSEKAKAVLADALHLKRMNLPWDFVLQVAAQFKDDPQIKEAGERFAKTDVMESWQLWTEDRQNWPIYNWIDDYVIKLNAKK